MHGVARVGQQMPSSVTPTFFFFVFLTQLETCQFGWLAGQPASFGICLLLFPRAEVQDYAAMGFR